MRKTSPPCAADLARERTALLTEIVGKSYLAMGRELPDRDERRLIVATWEEIVAPIPTARLGECYVYAMRERAADNRSNLGAQELVAAWRALCAAGAVTRRDPDPLTGPRMAPDELAAEIRALRERLWPDAAARERGTGFSRLAEVRPSLEGGAAPEYVTCPACSLEYTARPQGCPRCAAKAKLTGGAV